MKLRSGTFPAARPAPPRSKFPTGAAFSAGRAISPLLVLLAALIFPDAGRAASTTHYDVAGDDIVIYDLIGTIRIEPGTGTDVGVDVTLDGADAARLRVETGPKGDHPSLRVIYPGDRFVYGESGRHSSSEMTIRDDGTFGNEWTGRRVHISGGGRGLDAHADLAVFVPGNRAVTVHVGVGRVNASRVNGRLKVHTVSGPVSGDDLQGSLDVNVGSGSVRLNGMRGPLSVDTGSGDVDVARADGRRIHVDTGSGSVSGVDIAADVIDVDTGSGSIEIASLDASDIKLDTGSGSVKVDLVGDVDRLVVDTGSGGVRIGVPENLGADLVVDTGSGGIDISVPHQAINSRRSFFHGRLGDGDGRISVDTGSGSVHIVSAGRAERD